MGIFGNAVGRLKHEIFVKIVNPSSKESGFFLFNNGFRIKLKTPKISGFK